MIAAFAHLVAQLLGGKGSFYGGRIALFWALVAASPALLTSGLVAGVGGSSDIFGLIAGMIFVMFWVMMLREAERA